MQETDSFCLQCQRLSSAPSNRLVQDSCGHKKCRSCLLDDVDNCKQCALNEQNEEKSSIPKITDNHTAVIQCNGKARLNCDKIPDEVLEKKWNWSISSNKKQGTNFLDGANKTVIKKQENKKEMKKLKKKIASKKKLIDVPPHIILQSDPSSYLCTVCNKTFFTKAHVKYHQYCAGDMKPYKCEKCGKEFILKVQLQVHMYKHENIKPYSCSVCQKSFSEKNKLSRHMVLHSSAKNYICPDCAKAFKSKESLRIHCLIHKVEKPFACTVCTAKFNNSSNLKKHLVSHSDEKAHMCDQCGRRFKLKWALSVHRKSHLRVRPHTCNLCFKNFVNFKDLQRHTLVHSESKGYTCGICHTSFRRKDNLHRHMKNTHPGKKGEVIKNDSKAPAMVAKKPAVLVDNPNAIKVITASPAITKSIAEAVVAPPQRLTAKSTDSRPTGSVINGPIKLAFKTPAFKSHYNIARDCDFLPPAQIAKSLPLADSVDMAQNMLSSDPLKVVCEVDEHISSEIRQPVSVPSIGTDEAKLSAAVSVSAQQQNLATYSSTFHYETSFRYGTHAMIKNIKFKVPEQYTNLFKQSTNKVDDSSNFSDNNNDDYKGRPVSEDTKVYSELKPVANPSVIVNNSTVNQTSDVHWRRRTSQNLVLKN